MGFKRVKPLEFSRVLEDYMRKSLLESKVASRQFDEDKVRLSIQRRESCVGLQLNDQLIKYWLKGLSSSANAFNEMECDEFFNFYQVDG